MATAKPAPAKPRVPAPPPLAPNIAYRRLNPTGTPAQQAGFGPGSIEDQPGTSVNGDGSGDGSGSPIDWAHVYFGQYNLPSDLINQIESLGKQYGTTNPDVFFQSAQNLVRQSDWFKATYPGFAAGVTAGLFSDENGYRGYVNDLNQVYQQFTGRHVSGDEAAAALAQGATPALIGRQFQGDAIANVNAPDWQYLTGAFDENGALTAAERTAYGREQAGIDTPLGQMVQKRVTQAMGRAQALFRGTLATPSLTVGATGRLTAPSLGAGTSPDIGA